MSKGVAKPGAGAGKHRSHGVEGQKGHQAGAGRSQRSFVGARWSGEVEYVPKQVKSFDFLNDAKDWTRKRMESYLRDYLNEMRLFQGGAIDGATLGELTDHCLMLQRSRRVLYAPGKRAIEDDAKVKELADKQWALIYKCLTRFDLKRSPEGEAVAESGGLLNAYRTRG